MFAPETAETTGFKQCRSCGAEQINRDKFCRRCGASQGRRGELSSCMTGSNVVAVEPIWSSCETARLSEAESRRRSYSGPLVNIVTQQLLEQTSSLRANRLAMLLISLLVAAPLWLMILLLSPLDAYVAAKELTKQV